MRKIKPIDIEENNEAKPIRRLLRIEKRDLSPEDWSRLMVVHDKKEVSEILFLKEIERKRLTNMPKFDIMEIYEGATYPQAFGKVIAVPERKEYRPMNTEEFLTEMAKAVVYNNGNKDDAMYILARAS